jgi:hypothetical protein
MNILKKSIVSVFLATGVYNAQGLTATKAVMVSTNQTINQTNYANAGQSFFVTSDVYEGQELIVAKGTPVNTQIIYEPRKPAGTPGVLTLNFLSTIDTKGNIVLLNGSFTATGKDKLGHVLGVGIGVGIFIAPMFLYILKPGGHPEIQPMTHIASIR